MSVMTESRIEKQERRRRIRDVVARNELHTQEELRELLVPIEAAELQAHPVSTEVNKTDHDHAKLIEPVENPTPTLF